VVSLKGEVHLLGRTLPLSMFKIGKVRKTGGIGRRGALFQGTLAKDGDRWAWRKVEGARKKQGLEEKNKFREVCERTGRGMTCGITKAHRESFRGKKEGK